MRTEPVAKPQGFSDAKSRGYEPRDARVGIIFGVILFLVVSVIIIHFILKDFLGHMNRKPEPQDGYEPRQRAGVEVTHPTVPRLQLSAPADLQAFRTREAAELNSYGWVNQSSGIVHIPIERAMELVLEKGLPIRTKPGEEKLGPSIYELQQKRP